MFFFMSKFFNKMIFSRVIFMFAVLSIFCGCISISRIREIEEAYNPSSEKIPPENIPDDGYIRLVLNENKGCFSIFYLTDPKTMRYEPLLNPNNTSASFLSVLVDGNTYRLGCSAEFNTRIERIKGDTALIFESPFLKVTQLFTPVKTPNSQAVNGVMITITLQNTATQRSFVGLNMLLDTELGEGKKGVPILTNKRIVSSELFIEGNSTEKFWISRGKKTSLMGSIVNPVKSYGRPPDGVHIANWKRLNEAAWRLPYSKGRSFNNLPSSADDSAVCYYFGPEMLDLNRILTYTVYLTTEDAAWYNMYAPPFKMTASIVPEENPPKSTAQIQENGPLTREEFIVNIADIEAQTKAETAETNNNADAVILLKLQEILNQFISGQISLSENDLLEIERTIEKYRIRNETY